MVEKYEIDKTVVKIFFEIYTTPIPAVEKYEMDEIAGF